MLKISIITVLLNAISNKNGKENLLQMFKSIHNQDYENIEHIIIDGLSNDGTLEYVELITKEFAKKPVFIYSQKDTGIYNAMNKGINKAQGELIAFMNADDYYLEDNAISLLGKAIIDNPKASFSFCATRAIDFNKSYDSKPSLDKAFFSSPFYHQALLCKKDLFEKYGLFDESLRVVADYDFITKIIKACEKGIEVNKLLVCYRLNGFSAQNKSLAYDEFAKVIHKNCNNKKFSISDCRNIYCHKFTIILLIKLKLFPFILKNTSINYKISNKLLFKSYSSLILTVIKNFFKFRFIIKPIEKLLKK